MNNLSVSQCNIKHILGNESVRASCCDTYSPPFCSLILDFERTRNLRSSRESEMVVQMPFNQLIVFFFMNRNSRTASWSARTRRSSDRRSLSFTVLCAYMRKTLYFNSRQWFYTHKSFLYFCFFPNNLVFMVLLCRTRCLIFTQLN